MSIYFNEIQGYKVWPFKVGSRITLLFQALQNEISLIHYDLRDGIHAFMKCLDPKKVIEKKQFLAVDYLVFMLFDFQVKGLILMPQRPLLIFMQTKTWRYI